MSNPTARLTSLDSLRGLSAVYVLLFHYTCAFDELFRHTPKLPHCFPYGNYAVYLFMIISGFVIFMTLEKTRSWKDFAIARFGRLYPAYWAALAATFTITHVLGLPHLTRDTGDALVNLTMVQSLFGIHHVDDVYWSLTVEVLFYFAMMILFVTGLIRHITSVLVVWLLVSIAKPTLPDAIPAPVAHALMQLPFLQFIPWFATGIVFYRYWKRRSMEWGDWAILALWPIAVLRHEQAIGYRPATFSVVCFAVLMFAVVRGWGRWLLLENPVLLYLGKLSYTLYLVHNFIGFSLMLQFQAMGLPWAIYMPLTGALALGLAAALHYTVEKPAMEWVRVWVKQKSALAWNNQRAS
jgi:peptidoglycan/LPS O-acetylase OafA/YrhL